MNIRQEIISKQVERFKCGLESCFQKEPILVLRQTDSAMGREWL